jgi:hypothetical protein
VLLLDKDQPLLLDYADFKGMALEIWGPFPVGFDPQKEGCVIWFSACFASAEPCYGMHKMTLSEYLDTPVGVVPRPNREGQPPEGIPFTPRELIKWVANKEGVAHFQLDPHADLEAVKKGIIATGTVSTGPFGEFGATDDLMVRLPILQIAQWTVRAIETLLTTPSVGLA